MQTVNEFRLENIREALGISKVEWVNVLRAKTPYEVEVELKKRGIRIGEDDGEKGT